MMEPFMVSPGLVFAFLDLPSILSNFNLGELLVGLSTEGSSLMSRSSCFTGLSLSRDESKEHAEEEDSLDDSIEKQLDHPSFGVEEEHMEKLNRKEQFVPGPGGTVLRALRPPPPRRLAVRRPWRRSKIWNTPAMHPIRCSNSVASWGSIRSILAGIPANPPTPNPKWRGKL